MTNILRSNFLPSNLAVSTSASAFARATFFLWDKNKLEQHPDKKPVEPVMSRDQARIDITADDIIHGLNKEHANTDKWISDHVAQAIAALIYTKSLKDDDLVEVSKFLLNETGNDKAFPLQALKDGKKLSVDETLSLINILIACFETNIEQMQTIAQSVKTFSDSQIAEYYSNVSSILDGTDYKLPEDPGDPSQRRKILTEKLNENLKSDEAIKSDLSGIVDWLNKTYSEIKK
jgi:hypothetical protein